MAGRTAITDTAAAGTAHWSQPGINVPVWGIAVATLLPTLVVLLAAWQVRADCLFCTVLQPGESLLQLLSASPTVASLDDATAQCLLPDCRTMHVSKAQCTST
jgi:hypothetical protein